MIVKAIQHAFKESKVLEDEVIQLIQVQGKEITNLINKDKRMMDRVTSIEPQKKRFFLNVVSGFKEPVEESPAMAFVDSNIPGVLPEVHRRLPGKATYKVGFLLSQYIIW